MRGLIFEANSKPYINYSHLENPWFGHPHYPVGVLDAIAKLKVTVSKLYHTEVSWPKVKGHICLIYSCFCFCEDFLIHRDK